MSTLDTKTVERIEAAALKLFPVNPYRGPDAPETEMDRNEYERDLWKFATTAEALRYKSCVEALEKIAKMPIPAQDIQLWLKTAHEAATTALKNLTSA